MPSYRQSTFDFQTLIYIKMFLLNSNITNDTRVALSSDEKSVFALCRASALRMFHSSACSSDGENMGI